MARFGRRKGIGKRGYFFLAMVLFLALTIQSFWYVENKIEPVLLEYANMKVKQIAEDAINDAISKKIVAQEDFDNLFATVQDQAGNIQMISLNVREAARIEAEATARVKNYLEEISNERIGIPLGVAFNSNILASYGPNIPITMVPLGTVEANIDPVLQEKGINMVLLTINLHIKTTVKVVIPFASNEAVVEQDIMIDSILIRGEVPNYYFNGQEYVPFQMTPPPSPPAK